MAHQKSLEQDDPFETSNQDRVSKLNSASSAVEEIGTDFTFKHRIKWFNLIGYIIYHILGIIGIVQFLTLQSHPLTLIYSFTIMFLGGIMGITMGAHRYFTHRTFKATTILRRILLISFITAGQNSLWEWVRNHRQHHKYSDTDADPHNARRGLFFSHIGWFLSYKNPKVIKYGKGIDMSDIEADSWIMFQKRNFVLVYFVVSILIPSIIPIIFWNEDPVKSFLICFFARTVAMLNFTCTVNSFAHAYGTRPYDKSIVPVQNVFVTVVTNGEGWHNYHHVFPWDYKASELGNFNLTTNLIHLYKEMGWIYDLKTVKEEHIRKRMEKTGEQLNNNFE